MRRRDFFKYSALTSASMMVPGFLKAIGNTGATPFADNGKILVVIQLSGGNDGLNTIVPYRNDEYYRLRPKISLEGKDRINVTDNLGFNAGLWGIADLFSEGHVAVVNNVGYPNPDRSHFRSMDIWHTASASDEYLSTGWLGRYLDSACIDNCMPYHAIEVDDTLSLAMKGQLTKGIAMKDPNKLYKATNSSYFNDLVDNHHSHDHKQADYLYKTMAETLSSAKYIHDTSKVYKSSVEYPNTELGRHMKLMAELIISGINSKVFYASLGGFDTHIWQVNNQNRLLAQYSEAVTAFVEDLKKNDKFKDVMIMTFSEFGRRVSQNKSGGTDHGTANNVTLISQGLKNAGFRNEEPDLLNLDDNGDLKYTVDFRSIYSTLINKWLGCDDQIVMNSKFDYLDFI